MRRFEQLLGVIGVLALLITWSLVSGWNPIPGLLEKVGKVGGLARPEASWVERVGGQPSAAVVADRAVIVTMRGAIEARDIGTGAVIWKRDADWAAVAGDEATTVVVVGRRGHGLEVVEPASGATRWTDGAAIGAWTYRETVLTLSCAKSGDCQLTSRAPGDGATRWKAGLPGIRRVHAGVNSDLFDSRQLTSTYRDAVAAVPEPLPALLGFPIDDKVQMVDTATGRLLRKESPTGTSRVVAVGGRVLVSTAVPRDGNCRYAVDARDAASGRSVWKKEGYDLRTASGAGCEQGRDPAGANGVLAATRGDNREVFIGARDGRELWVGAPGDKIVATDGRYGLVRGPDGSRIVAIDLSNGSKVWEQQTVPKSDVTITRWAVLISDPAAGRIRAYQPDTAKLLVDVKTGGEVLGYGPTGLMIGRGRTIGFVPYGTIL